ncbi:tetratricopeptide repeat protein [Elusimicrobiota bacterium]
MTRWKAYALILGATLFVYLNSFNTSFHFDDEAYILKNHAIFIDDLSLKNIWNLVRYPGVERRPFASLGFGVNRYLMENKVFGYHVINWIVHAVNALLVYHLLLMLFLKKQRNPPTQPPPQGGRRRTGETPPPGGRRKTERSEKEERWGQGEDNYKETEMVLLMAALFWAIHPVHTQVVTYVWQRITALATMGFLGGFICYIKAVNIPSLACGNPPPSLPHKGGGEKRKWTKENTRKVLWMIGALLCAVFAFGHKEISATLPLFLILYEIVFVCDLNIAKIKNRLHVFSFLTIIFIALSYLYLQSPTTKHLASPDMPQLGFLGKLLTESRILIYYISLFLLPHPNRLMLDYDYTASAGLFSPPQTIVCVALIIGLLGLAFRQMKNKPIAAFAILWFFGNCAIEAVMPEIDLIFEHRVYLPSIGIVILGARGVIRLVNGVTAATKQSLLLRLPRFARNDRGYAWSALKIAGIAWLILLGLWTLQRNTVWKNEITLWSDNAAKAPKNARVRNNLALALSNKGDTDAAIHQYEESIKLQPDHGQTYKNYGVALFKKGLQDEAIAAYKKALETLPDDSGTYYNLGYVYLTQNKLDKAIETYNRGLECTMPYANIYINLCSAYLKKGMKEQAKESCEMAAKFFPTKQNMKKYEQAKQL